MKYSFLGVWVEPLAIDDLHVLIGRSVDEGRRRIVANHNLHSIYTHHTDPGMRAFYQKADHIHVDGMAIVMLGRLLGFPLERRHRVTYVDWIRPLMSQSTMNGWRVFFLGSKPGVAEKAADILRSENPGLRIRVADGYFDSTAGTTDSERVLAEINAFAPNILMVGMGMPRQERWILDHLERLQTNVILTAGACMDYVAGVVATPPRWMGRVGLEWLYRLSCEPGRLWKRYLGEPWFVAFLLLRQLIRRREPLVRRA
jgi:N-acetylglucosaminyldiphosphoundecaprenol N-acetyl-beta-D-mannosaminyltransferase